MSVEEKKARSRIIQVNGGVIGPAAPKVQNLKPKSPADFPAVPDAFIEVAKLYSSGLLLGPPLCDELMELVRHMFTEEEARLIRHLKPLRSATARKLARAEGVSETDALRILQSVADEKRLIMARGQGPDRLYTLLPIVPGAFEMALVRVSKDSLTDWHRRFAELFHNLWATGFALDYVNPKSQPSVRYLPVGQAISAHPMALPSDKLEEVFGRYKDFAVGLCQCRLTEDILGNGCGKPMENCTAMGPAAEWGIRSGKLTRRTLSEILEIKREAEAHGLVTWMINEEGGKAPSASCSCCGCCCHMLRTITEFNAPGWIAPPHFRPAFDNAACNYCGKCALSCPMGAISMDIKNKNRTYLAERCVGCGQCVIACEKKAVQMKSVEKYQAPPATMASLLVKSLPGYLVAAWRNRKNY